MSAAPRDYVELKHLSVHFGWMWKEDGVWYSTPRSEVRGETYGPFRTHEQARAAVAARVEFGASRFTEGTWALVNVTDRNMNNLHNTEAAGSVTYLASDDAEQSSPHSIRWEMDRDGVLAFNAWSGAGTALQTEAKGEAMMVAVRTGAVAVNLHNHKVTA
jgi:hypothetical protein